MWFIFPQIAGLGLTRMSRFFALGGREDAYAYLAHPLLGPRLLESSRALLAVEGRTANQIFASPHDLKLCSSATLFATISEADSLFHRILVHYFDGAVDGRTLALLERQA